MPEQAIQKREVTLETVQHMTGYELPQIALVRTKMAGSLGVHPDKVPLRDVLLYIQAAQELGLSPLLGQIHWIARGGKASHQVGIDGLRAIADRSGAYAGSDSPTFRGEIEQPYFDNKNKEQSMRVPEMASVLVRKIVQGRVCSFTGEAYWREFYPPGEQGFMYRKMPRLMLAKDAEAQALRKAFPAQLGGVQYSSVDVAEVAEVAEDLADKQQRDAAAYQRIYGDDRQFELPAERAEQQAEAAVAEDEESGAQADTSPQEADQAEEQPQASAWSRNRELSDRAAELRVHAKTLRSATPLEDVEAYNEDLASRIEAETERRRGVARRNLAS